ncbi:MAG TPA: DUF5995 family protein [Phycisphaerae bacterium]|nr:DUF5995 family protein [Phycisphaerae bacterium]
MPNPLLPTPAATVADVIQRMQDIDAVLPDGDGLKWFNYLYLAVTQTVQDQLAAGALFFGDRAWIDRLDVVFANLYFATLTQGGQGGPNAAPRAWRPLLANRMTPKIARIQFALAGMNAHINRDLVLALLAIYTVDGQAPGNDSVHYQDFTKVNQLLSQVEGQVRETLLVGTPLASGGDFAPLEDILAMWSVDAARQAAWDHSQAFWNLRGLPPIQSASLDALDGLTELASNGLIVRVLP